MPPALSNYPLSAAQTARSLSLHLFSVNVCTCLNHRLTKAAGSSGGLQFQAEAALKPHQGLLRDSSSSELENAGMERRHNLSVLPVLQFGTRTLLGKGFFSHPAKNVSCLSSRLLSTSQGTFSICRTRQSQV